MAKWKPLILTDVHSAMEIVNNVGGGAPYVYVDPLTPEAYVYFWADGFTSQAPQETVGAVPTAEPYAAAITDNAAIQRPMIVNGEAVDTLVGGEVSGEGDDEIYGASADVSYVDPESASGPSSDDQLWPFYTSLHAPIFLAPNPVRRRKPSDHDPDTYHLLPVAVERAARRTYEETNRQFPNWMISTCTYFVGKRNKYVCCGEPIPVEQTEEVGVAMGFNSGVNDVITDVDSGSLASSSYPIADPTGADTRGITVEVLHPERELFPSEASYTTPQMELDPDLDSGSSWICGVVTKASSLRSFTPADFLGKPSYAPQAPPSYTPIRDEYWQAQDAQDVLPQPEEEVMAVEEPLAGSSSNMAEFGYQSYSDSVPSGSNERDWDSTFWAQMSKFSLLANPSGPLPAHNMSTESSLSGMIDYFHTLSPLELSVDDVLETHVPGRTPAFLQMRRSLISALITAAKEGLGRAVTVWGDVCVSVKPGGVLDVSEGGREDFWVAQ
ncbi:hypothetical protein JB92DRAFT_3111560 [Gautieria morchelliformis]|nr:hypothetical protein JB92DRAFT_3111560 [Gautieria morchelliformis]